MCVARDCEAQAARASSVFAYIYASQPSATSREYSIIAHTHTYTDREQHIAAADRKTFPGSGFSLHARCPAHRV